MLAIVCNLAQNQAGLALRLPAMLHCPLLCEQRLVARVNTSSQSTPQQPPTSSNSEILCRNLGGRRWTASLWDFCCVLWLGVIIGQVPCFKPTREGTSTKAPSEWECVSWRQGYNWGGSTTLVDPLNGGQGRGSSGAAGVNGAHSDKHLGRHRLTDGGESLDVREHHRQRLTARPRAGIGVEMWTVVDKCSVSVWHPVAV